MVETGELVSLYKAGDKHAVRASAKHERKTEEIPASERGADYGLKNIGVK